MENQTVLSRVNKATFARGDVLKYFQNLETLFEAEKVIFEKLYATIKDSKMLDLGIGGGRTTKYLLQITSDYTGIDYVADFADQAAGKYPEAKIKQGDARDLSEFADETFDFVLFSYNGIDCVSHEDRLKVLREIHRVLKKGGAFMFSSHNRDYKYFNKLPWQQKIHFSKQYLTFSLYCLYHLPKHFKMKRHEVFTDEYAIVNDGDHRFSLLLYYISIEKQIEQLEKIGFSGTEAYNFSGETVELRDTTSHWIYYLAKKD
jgi:ubiquinone/menaquinone biosynthesis C-methylase UbiE